jgi:hypothetical protein
VNGSRQKGMQIMNRRNFLKDSFFLPFFPAIFKTKPKKTNAKRQPPFGGEFVLTGCYDDTVHCLFEDADIEEFRKRDLFALPRKSQRR